MSGENRAMPMLEVMRTLWPLMLKGSGEQLADPAPQARPAVAGSVTSDTQNGEFVAAEPRDDQSSASQPA